MKKTIIALSIITSLPAFANMNDHVASETNTGHKVEVGYVTSDSLSIAGAQGQIGIDDFALTLGVSSGDNLDMYNAGLKYGGENFFGEVSTTWFDVDGMDNAYDVNVGYQWAGEASLMHVKVAHKRFSQEFYSGTPLSSESKASSTSLDFGGVKILNGDVDKGIYLTYGTGVQYLSSENDGPSGYSDSETGVYGKVGAGYTVSGFNIESDINYNTNLEEAIFSINAGYNF